MFQGEPVAARQRPLRLPRFGVGAVMVMTGVLACQYALIGYFGPVAAMAVPPVVCGGFILALLAFEIFAWRNPASEARHWGRRNSGWAVGYILILGLSAYLTGGAQIGYDWFVQWRLERQVQQDLGFSSTTGYVWDGSGQARKAIVVLFVEPGGPLEDAGVMTGEAILSELTPAEWFRMVEDNRGQPIDLTVAPAAVGRPAGNQRTVTIRVPHSGAGWLDGTPRP